MKISKEELLHVARLARLDLDERALETFADQIGTILTYVDQLKSVDTGGVRPTSHAIPLSNAFRDDELKNHLDTKTALSNAPESDDGSFIVPKVVG